VAGLLDAPLIRPPMAALADLDWAGAGLRVAQPECADDGPAMVAYAVAGVAETGSVLVASGGVRPMADNFLAAVHVVALARDRIVKTLEEAWAMLPAPLPRAVSLITGPSRTGDIEQTLIPGAHGPKRLIVALIDPPAAAASR
ncbi:MAG TPA: hypothetical protein ENK15_01705, partial [Thermopetrobacter sp.]|nr:hypothetical protein [Thermopetrobacter sp.]